MTHPGRLVALFAGFGLIIVGAPTKTPKTSAPKPVSAKKTVAANRSRGKAVRKRVKANTPSYQLHPDTERYQEVQNALATRGYFKGEANGQWNDDSVSALQRFQTDQKINNDGKISSLSLINLGLGPKHDSRALSSTGNKIEPAVVPLAPDTLTPPEEQ